MSKYIDAEKLIERLEEMKQAEYENCGGVNSKTGALQEVQELIDSLQQEQPKVNLELEKEIEQYTIGFIGELKCYKDWTPRIARFARHFYGLRNRALEEAARHVYESWMGGTMDDVRRDMVELDRVINARKDESK